jgi:seryl-tRNA synthetase
MAHPDAPIGKGDNDNLEVKQAGKIRDFDFEPLDHVKLA